MANRAAMQVDELLDNASMQMGRALDLDTRPVDLVELTAKLVAEHQQQTDKHELRLEQRVSTLVTLVDERRLRERSEICSRMPSSTARMEA